MNEEPKYDVAGVYRVALKSDNEACLGRWSEVAQRWLVGHLTMGRTIATDQEVTVLGKLTEHDLRAAGCIR